MREAQLNNEQWKKWNKQRFTIRDPREIKLMNILLKNEMKKIDKYSDATQMLICHFYGKINEAAKKLSAKP